MIAKLDCSMKFECDGLPFFCSMRPNASAAFRNFEQEARQSAVWDSEQNVASSSGDNLASLYRPPFSLMFNGPFDKVSCISIISSR